MYTYRSDATMNCSGTIHSTYSTFGYSNMCRNQLNIRRTVVVVVLATVVVLQLIYVVVVVVVVVASTLLASNYWIPIV